VLATFTHVPVERLRGLDPERHGTLSWPAALRPLADRVDDAVPHVDVGILSPASSASRNAASRREHDHGAVAPGHEVRPLARVEQSTQVCGRVRVGRCGERDAFAWVPVALALGEEPPEEVTEPGLAGADGVLRPAPA